MERLLPIKLAAPHPSRRPVNRRRLVEVLAGALDARLTLLSAPAGFGKTTALLDWFEACGIRHAWISLDETDNDAVRFLRYLGAAVGRLLGQDWAPDSGPVRPDALEVIDEYAALLAQLNEPAVLVLDDYHAVAAVEVQRAVGLLLDRMPAPAHLVIATRADPALPLARLRARGELLELRADALRFTVDEARQFFAERMRVELAELDLESLVERTEGWPAALQLAGLSIAGRANAAERVRQFAATNRYLLDFVVEEVLAGLPAETQAFLLRTSILERLSGPLCEAVTGERDAQTTLESLERANLLIVPLDDERRWYRYHGLFAEILRARLASLSPDEAVALHARAASWFEEQGYDDEAIAHALRSQDTERLSRLVAEASGRHINAGEVSTVRRWLDAVPSDLVHNHAQLSASYAWCQIIAGETVGVKARLDDAETALAAGRGGGPAMAPAIPTQLAMLRSQLAGLEGDSANAIEQARLAATLVPEGLPPQADAILRGMATALLALAFSNAGRLDAAAATFEEAVPMLRRGGNVMALGRGIADLAAVYLALGEPLRALRLCESELDMGSAECSAAATGATWAALAEARAALGQFETAEVAARRGFELALRAGDRPSARSAQATLARLGQGAVGGRGPRATSPQGGLVEALTARELEVLRLVALGRSNRQIAVELFVTAGTVKSHLHTIAGKLGATNRVEAVARGRESGLLS